MADTDADAVDVKRLSLIDVSFEDDRLIDTSPSRPAGPRCSDDQSLELLPGLDLENADVEGNEMASKPLKSAEQRVNKTPENYHLRKSLAWDAAFFTNDGVLEPEELTSMIEDAGKKEKRTLPMILEETQRSTESISTLESDTLTIASLEAELFEDIRASIQKSSKTPNVQNSGSEAGQSSFDAHGHRSIKKDPASNGKLKVKLASTKSSLGMVRPGKTTNQVPVHRRVSQVKNVAADSLSFKPPKPGVLPPTPSAAKRESMGANRMKLEKNNIEGRGASTPKVPASSGNRNLMPRPSSSRSSARSVSVNTEMTPTCDSSASSSSDRIGKSPANLRNKGVDTKSRKLSSASSSTVKTPPRSTPSRLSARLISATKLSSSISPASSISEWSSESSSSTSTVKQRSTGSRASLEPSSSEKTCNDSDNGQQLDGSKTHGSTSTTLHAKNASMGATLLLPNSMRPSGLRMPSPKIGFFDGVKSGRTPNANRQSPRVVPGRLPKAETAKPDGTMNKVKVGKFQSARTAVAIGSAKGGSPKSLPPESSNSAEKVSSASRSVQRTSPGISPRVQSRLSPRFGGKNRSNVEEVRSKETDVNTYDDNERPEDKPVLEVLSSRNTSIDGGGLETSNVIMDVVDKVGARSPVKWESDVENGTVFDQSLSNDSPEHLLFRNFPVCSQKELMDCSSKPLPSPSIAKTDIATGVRQPFAAINSFCNMDESSDVSAELAAAELGKRIASPTQSSLNE
ncbi:hypothetical protein CDL15_Pgr001951 [Punica granatum]|uniref:Uncharacterized protein n=1 Tax=Punica granatum TaxID=22663 RepID=A0A218XBQ7_PUNGR|nr:hypothetical protein CDL15_Pgr001951 [Punica granatum]